MSFPDLPGYRIEGVLGQGAMGCVYRGTHLESDQAVAIKTLLSRDPSLQRALSNEWEVLQKVEHPLLVDERELLQIGDNTYLVMELIDGQSLTHWIESRSSRQRELEGPAVLEQICQVLSYLHSRQPPVIVRDLKPDNILIRPDGSIKLIDFGISRTLVANGRTEVGLKGFASAAYAPLEQYSAQATTGTAADIYALGATTYHLLTGRPPASAIDLMSERISLEQHLLQAGFPLAWASLVAAAMRIKAEQRISLAEFFRRIPGSQQPEPAAPLAPVAPTDSSWGASWKLIAILVLLALAALLFLAP